MTKDTGPSSDASPAPGGSNAWNNYWKGLFKLPWYWILLMVVHHIMGMFGTAMLFYYSFPSWFAQRRSNLNKLGKTKAFVLPTLLLAACVLYVLPLILAFLPIHLENGVNVPSIAVQAFYTLMLLVLAVYFAVSFFNSKTRVVGSSENQNQRTKAELAALKAVAPRAV